MLILYILLHTKLIGIVFKRIDVNTTYVCFILEI